MLRPCGWRHKSKQLHMSCIVWDCIKFNNSDNSNKSSQNRHAIRDAGRNHPCTKVFLNAQDVQVDTKSDT